MVHQFLPLRAWSWQEIYKSYKAFGDTLVEYRQIKRRCGIPDEPDIGYTDHNNQVILRFNRDVTRIDRQLSELDHEIARRNNLIGVV